MSEPNHIVVVFEENKDFSQIIGNPDADYINELAMDGMSFTNHHGLTHPSQPNYIALFTGSTYGVQTDNPVALTVPNLADQLETHGFSFAGWAGDNPPLRHMPWMSIPTTVANTMPLDKFPTTASGFEHLPTVSFISPDDQDNMHDGSIARADDWLQSKLGAYAQWAETHDSLLIVTFDEADKDSTNHIATVVVGDGVPHMEVGLRTDHYSLLRGIEDQYGLGHLGNAANATVVDLQPDPPIGEHWVIG